MSGRLYGRLPLVLLLLPVVGQRSCGGDGELAAETPTPVVVVGKVQKLHGRDVLLFQDATARLSLSEVLGSDVQARFVRDPRSTPAFGFTRAAIWVRLDLIARTRGPWILEVEEPLLHSVEFFGPVGGEMRRRAAGRLLPIAEREFLHRKLLFSLELGPVPQTYYVRIVSRDNVLVPLRLWPREQFFLEELTEQIVVGLLYGIVFGLVLYNLFLFLSLRDLNYLYYIVYVLGFALLRSSVDGSAFRYLPDLPPWLDWRLPLLGGLTAGLGLLLFTHRFLELPTLGRAWRYPYFALLFAVLALFAISASELLLPVASRYANLVSALSVLYVLVCAIFRTVTGFRPARYFVLGWLTLIAGVFGGSMVNLGVLPPNALTENLMAFGFVAELLFFSFALADRIRLLRAEKEAADARAFEAQQRLSEELETLVRERTRDLTATLAAKDRFLSTIAHDLRGPIGTLATMLEEGVEEGAVVEVSILASLRRTARNSFRLLEDLLRWAQSQRGDIVFAPERVGLAGLVAQSVRLLESTAQAKGVDVVVQVPPDLSVFADRDMVSLIVRNLIANAIKFTPRGGHVQVECAPEGDFVRVLVIDDGVGMDGAQLDALFRVDSKSLSRPGTDGERGSGLGLILCREFAVRNGDTIGATSIRGQGSRFYFTLPLQAA